MDYRLKNFILSPMNLLYKINPKIELEIMFKLKNGYSLSLDNPKTFNEKIQWMKLYDRNPVLPECVDKYTVRNFVKKRGREDLLNDLYWEGFYPEEIPFENLPNEFVIKVTHGSGFNIICRDKKKLNKSNTIKKLKKWLKYKYIPSYGEWFYGIVKPRIIIEKLLLQEDNEIPEDYKIFCFDGEPKYIGVDLDRYSGHKRDIYDTNWELKKGYKMGFLNSENELDKPTELKQLLSAARDLSEGFPHVRVDFYIVGNKVYFGEMTFTNGAGFDKIKPYEFDLELGSYFKIPLSNKT